MRPPVAHCHFRLAKLHHRRGNRERAQEGLTIATAKYREMAMTYGSSGRMCAHRCYPSRVSTAEEAERSGSSFPLSSSW
jgi:hypothetical protein